MKGRCPATDACVLTDPELGDLVIRAHTYSEVTPEIRMLLHELEELQLLYQDDLDRWFPDRMQRPVMQAIAEAYPAVELDRRGTQWKLQASGTVLRS